MLALMWPTTLWATEAWEVPLTIDSGVAQVTLHLGQWPEAQEGYDGYSDVPAYDAGAIRAWFEQAGHKLWRDIRPLQASGSQIWRLQLNQVPQADVTLTWSTEHLPPDVRLNLSGHGTVVDLHCQQQAHVTWTQPLQLKIEMTKENP